MHTKEVQEARKALNAALEREDVFVRGKVACRMCKAPVGESCRKLGYPSGTPTHVHSERREDAL